MDKNWLIRTKSNHILGPVSKEKVIELYKNGSLKQSDEICAGNGFWFFLREEDMIQKYLMGNEKQNFNPLSEAKDVLTATDHSNISSYDDNGKSPDITLVGGFNLKDLHAQDTASKSSSIHEQVLEMPEIGLELDIPKVKESEKVAPLAPVVNEVTTSLDKQEDTLEVEAFKEVHSEEDHLEESPKAEVDIVDETIIDDDLAEEEKKNARKLRNSKKVKNKANAPTKGYGFLKYLLVILFLCVMALIYFRQEITHYLFEGQMTQFEIISPVYAQDNLIETKKKRFLLIQSC